MARLIYVTQYNCSWSFTPSAWRKAVEGVVTGKDVNYDLLGRRLSRPLSKWSKQCRPLDWTAEDWQNELEFLKESDK